MSVDTQQYFRANHYDTILAMCGNNEACAQKYEFTFANNLADYMNPVERVYISSAELEVGYYVAGVRARTLTESETQAYGLAAAGGGLELHDMSGNWSDLGLETESTGGGAGPEPNPDGDAPGATPAPASTASPSSSPTAAVSSSSSSSSARDDILAATPAPGESATSGSEEISGDDASSSTSSSEHSSAGVSYVGGGDDDDGAVADTDLTAGDNGGSGGGFSLESKVAIGVSAAGAVLLIGIGVCLAVRRNKLRSARQDETGSFLCPPRNLAASGLAAVGDAGDPADVDGLQERAGRGGDGRYEEGDHEEEVGLYELPTLTSAGASLPGYATAVASVPEEEGHTIIVGPSGVQQVVKLTAADESEVSDFYSAVDSGAVETLVSWGISRDFARVALRRTDNDVQDALRIIAEGNMDYLLAIDHEK